MSFGPTSDVAADLERSMRAFDAAEHAALLIAREEVAAQTLAQALLYATTEAERALVRHVVLTFHREGVGGAFRVVGARDGGVVVWMTGSAKVRSTATRGEGVGALLAVGLQVEMRGSWDFEVRRK